MTPRSHPGLHPRFLPIARAVFVLYAITLVALTHWPRLRLDVPLIERPDLVAHFCAFGLLNATLIAAGLFGPSLSTRNIARATAACILYAPIDELTQSLPGVNRHTSWLDAAANIVGILAAGAGALALRRILARRTARTVDDPSR